MTGPSSIQAPGRPGCPGLQSGNRSRDARTRRPPARPAVGTSTVGCGRRPPRFPGHRVQRRPRGDVGVPRQQGRRGGQRGRDRPRGHRRPGPGHRPGGIPLPRAIRDARRDTSDPGRRAGLVLRRDRAARAGAPDDPPKRRPPGPDRRRCRDARGLLRPRARAADRCRPGDRVRLRPARLLRRDARARAPRVPRPRRGGPAAADPLAVARGIGTVGQDARRAQRCVRRRGARPGGPHRPRPGRRSPCHGPRRLARTSIERGSGRPCSGA